MISVTQAPCPRCGHIRSRIKPSSSGLDGCDVCRRTDEAAQETAPSGRAGWPRPLEILPPGFIIGGCRVEALVARGGMGSVHRAVRLDQGRTVAIKVLPAVLADDPEHRERFRREARILGELVHPRIVEILDRGEEGGRGFIVMEQVEGGSLRDRLRAGPLEPCDALEIAHQVLEALEAAHEAGIIHRDVKPSNVLLDRAGNVRLADFGIARLGDRLAAGEPELTLAGLPIGSFAYMSPEQRVSGRDVDERSDLHAVGMLLFEMLTGQRPAGPELPGSRRPGLDLRLDALVARALADDPAERHPSASAMRRELEPLRQVAHQGRRLLDRADLSLATGDLTGARALVEQAQSLIPDDPLVAETARRVEESTDPLIPALAALEKRLDTGDILGVRDALGGLAADHPGHAGVAALLANVEGRLRRIGLLASRAAAALRAGRDEEAWLAAGATFDYLPPQFAREADDVAWPDPHRILTDVDLLRRARAELEVARSRGDRLSAHTALRRIRSVAPLAPEVVAGSRSGGSAVRRVASWLAVAALLAAALFWTLQRPAGTTAAPSAAPTSRPSSSVTPPTASAGSPADSVTRDEAPEAVVEPGPPAETR